MKRLLLVLTILCMLYEISLGQDPSGPTGCDPKCLVQKIDLSTGINPYTTNTTLPAGSLDQNWILHSGPPIPNIPPTLRSAVVIYNNSTHTSLTNSRPVSFYTYDFNNYLHTEPHHNIPAVFRRYFCFCSTIPGKSITINLKIMVDDFVTVTLCNASNNSIVATLGTNLPYNINGTPHPINQPVSLTANTSYYINVALTNNQQPGGGGASQTLFQVQGDISGGNFIKDDCCKKDLQGVCKCRKAGKNLITNGNFSIASNYGFTSAYQYNNGNAAPNLVMPAQCKVVSKNDALIISPNWKVQDINTTFGNFLVVNGKTTQPLNTQSIIWQQTVTGLEKDSTYKFCMSLKHLPQSTFDLKPQVAFDVGPWMTVNTTSSITDWMQYTITFVAIQTSMTLKIRLKEDIPGDGNDLAIDDIGLTKLSKFPIDPINDLNQSQANGIITVTYKTPSLSDDVLPPGCKGIWTIGPLINFSGNPKSPADLSPAYTNLSWPLTTTFPGNPPYPLLSNTIYGIVLTVKGCECYADNMAGRVISAPGPKKKNANKQNTNTELIISPELKDKILKEIEIKEKGN